MSAFPVTPGVVPPGYEFRSVLGMGSTGWVSLARQTSLNRDVAIKTVLLGESSDSAVRRLEREGRALAGLNHPGIVRVHQLIPAPRALYLVMEFLPGETLQAATARDSVTPVQALSILSGISGTLAAVHGRGLTHRDLKLANVILHPVRGPVLVDFGLARLPRARSTFRTDAGTVTGTPLYLAPEQINNPQADSPAIDSYAFGVLAYQLLLDHYPYEAATLPDILRAHQHSTPTDPRRFRPRLTNSAATALVRALDKDPHRRPPPIKLMGQLASEPIATWTHRADLPLLPHDESASTVDNMLTVDRNSSTPVVRTKTIPVLPDTMSSPSWAPELMAPPTEPSKVSTSSSYLRASRIRRRLATIAAACFIGLVVGIAFVVFVVRR